MYQTIPTTMMNSKDDSNSFSFSDTTPQTTSLFDTVDFLLHNMMRSVEFDNNDNNTTTATTGAAAEAATTPTVDGDDTISSNTGGAQPLSKSREWASLSNDSVAYPFSSLADLSFSSKFFDSKDWIGGGRSTSIPSSKPSSTRKSDWEAMFMKDLTAAPPLTATSLPLPVLRSSVAGAGPTKAGLVCRSPLGESSSLNDIKKPTKKVTGPKRKRVYKSRKVIPDVKDYVDDGYLPSDILCGRGARTNKNPGNQLYLKWIETRKPLYQNSTDTVKRKIISEVQDLIEKNNCRILQLDKQVGKWYIIHRKTAYIKISQALRDKNDEETRAMKRKMYGPSRKKKKNGNKTTAMVVTTKRASSSGVVAASTSTSKIAV